MLKLNITNQHHIYVPELHHPNLQDEVDQIMVLAFLFDVKIKIQDIVTGYKKTLYIHIKNYTLYIRTDKMSHVPMWVELEILENRHYKKVLECKSYKNDIPYQTLLQMLRHLKETL